MKIISRSGFAAVAVLTAFGVSYSAINGTVAAIQGTQTWTSGNLVLIDLPSNTKKVLVTGSCMGPCFSPVTADSIAFLKDNTIQIVRSDGSSAQPTQTGISVPVVQDGGYNFGMHALYWLRLNNEAGVGDYFYWASTVSGGGIYRAKKGTTTVERLMNDRTYFWGGFSNDGRHAASASGPGGPWINKIDLVAKQALNAAQSWRGCNASISPDGAMIIHNLAPGTYNGAYYDESQCTRMRTYDNNAITDLCDIQCNNDMQHFSHFDNQVFMFRNHHDENNRTCAAPYNQVSGVIYNYVTREEIFLGAFCGYDYFPGKVGAFEQRVAEPSFTPASGKLSASPAKIVIATATAGASIRYTINGSDPTATSGTLMSAVRDSFMLTCNAGATVIVKAIAFKTGMANSIIASATYQGPAVTSQITVTAPTAGATLIVGNTYAIKWTNDSVLNPPGMMISCSVNGGLLFRSLTGTSSISILDSSWQNFKWTVPATLNGVSTISDSVYIHVYPYGDPGTYGSSGKLRIIAKTASAPTGAPALSLEGGFAARRQGNGYAFLWKGMERYVKRVTVVDLTGRSIADITNPASDGGALVWNGLDKAGKPVLAGIYLLKYTAGAETNWTRLPVASVAH